MTFRPFEDLRVFQLAEELADEIWDIVITWKYFEKITLGQQWVDAADSVGANIAEGTGRGSFADNRRFAKIARGSLFEVKHWLRRAYKRKLLTDKEIDILQKLTQELTPKLSAYIQSIGRQKETIENEKKHSN